MLMQTYSVACLAVIVSLVSAYPTGAPAGACATLNPDSHGPSTATGAPPYKLVFSSNSYQPGQVIQITLSGAMFKGFLIVGRKAGDSTNSSVGFFQNSTSPGVQLQCTDGKEGNGMTQTNNTVKSAVQLMWKAPSSSVGDVIFHYTVVRGGAPNVKVDPADYFMDIKSSPLKAASPRTRADTVHMKEEAENVAIVRVDEDGEEITYAVPSSQRSGRRE